VTEIGDDPRFPWHGGAICRDPILRMLEGTDQTKIQRRSGLAGNHCETENGQVDQLIDPLREALGDAEQTIIRAVIPRL
jgi:hypothetical protein